MRRTCAVIVAAWKAERWIAECVQSIRKQRQAPGWRIELAVGVDGCSSTSAALRRLRVGHWWSPENVGPYLVRNSLIERTPADAFAVFDADDVMLPDYLRRLLRMIEPDGIAGAARETINERGRRISARGRYQHGVSVFSAAAWSRLGGYRPWRVAADSDIIERAKALGIAVRSCPKVLYRRRRHDGSLTRAAETKIRSPMRNALWAESIQRTGAGELYVEPETVPLTWRPA